MLQKILILTKESSYYSRSLWKSVCYYSKKFPKELLFWPSSLPRIIYSNKALVQTHRSKYVSKLLGALDHLIFLCLKFNRSLEIEPRFEEKEKKLNLDHLRINHAESNGKSILLEFSIFWTKSDFFHIWYFSLLF